MKYRRRKSRLARREEAKNLRQAWFFGGLTVILVLVIIFLGIPFLIKGAAFLGDLRSSTQLVEGEDKIPPPPPQLYPLPKTVNEPKVRVEGVAEAGVKVVIFINGRSEKEVVADNDGNFKAELALSGRSEISAVAEDQAGNKSQESEKVVVFYDKEPPELEISSPGEEVSGWEDPQIEIRGKTEKGAKVYVNDHLVILGQEGDFSYRYSLSEGENQITVKAEDEAGNTTEKTIRVNYTPF